MKTLTVMLTLFGLLSNAQVTPVINSWILNTTSATGYAEIESNVQVVQYTDSNVYVSCTCIPGYSIGPWNNPNVASNQNFVYKITRFPQQNNGNPVAIGGGHTGVLTNGGSIFSAQDANTYNNQGVWHQNGYYFEYPSFDNCLGHPQQQGEYHHHVAPKCLFDETDSTHHSAIIGFAFDGFPIYGAYGYTNVNGTGGIKRMNSSYAIRNITDRTTLPNGTTASSAGPSLSAYSLGHYLEDYVYTTGSGDLDEHNGRFCVTPEFPDGTYAYFVTIDATLSPAYPYTLGTTYHGTVPSGNIDMGGPGTGGHNTITETTTIYDPSAGVSEVTRQIKFQLSPNPVTDYAFIYFDPASSNNIQGYLYDIQGNVLKTFNNLQPAISYSLDLSKYAPGTYFLRLETENNKVVQQIIKVNN